MKIGYARVSTTDQNLDMQLDALKNYGCEKIYHEKVSTRKDQIELNKALSDLREGDSLVVYKLDRLGRSTGKLIMLLNELQAKKISIVFLQEGIDTNTAIGQCLFVMASAFAQLERDLIRERTKSGLVAARKRGIKGGRKAKSPTLIMQMQTMYDNINIPITQILHTLKISKGTLYKYVKQGNRK